MGVPNPGRAEAAETTKLAERTATLEPADEAGLMFATLVTTVPIRLVQP